MKSAAAVSTLVFAVVLLSSSNLFSENERRESVYKPGTFVDKTKKGDNFDSLKAPGTGAEDDRLVTKQAGGTRLMTEPGKYVDLEDGGGVQKVGGVYQVEGDAEYFRRRIGELEKEIKMMRKEISVLRNQMQQVVGTAPKEAGAEEPEPKVLSA